MLKTVLMTTSLAAGVLLFDVAQPITSGGTAAAQQLQQKQKRAPAFRPPPKVAPRVVPRVNVVRQPVVRQKPNVVFRKPPVVIQKKVVTPKFTPKFVPKQPLKANIPNNLKGNPQVLPKGAFPKGGLPKGPGLGMPKGPGFPKGPVVVNPLIGNQLPKGPGLGQPKVFPPKKQFPVVLLGNKQWPVQKGPHKLWWKGGWKVFVPFTAITVATIGGAYYYPDAYVSVARPYCAGITPDGCRLNWQEVPFADGGSEFQCVQFCPRPSAPPPPRAVAFVAAPPAPSAGRCELEIFGQPQFQGASAPNNVDQPNLIEAGWKNEISSIQVKAGTWDFFTDEDFAGENMRLPPGPYPDLGPEWTKKIGSFMCVQGG
jgi:hypothetical protein